MCGGAGTRLWPASRDWRPKTFVAFNGRYSLFQETALRVAALARDNLIIVAGAAHAGIITKQLGELDLSAALLLEPMGRDSAPAMAAACAWIAERDPDGVAVIVAADHQIDDASAFCSTASVAAGAARDGHIVTMGIVPTSPSTAYGYISPGGPIGGVREVKAFVEKPTLAKAKSYLAKGYLWNSGNFVVSAKTLLTALDKHEPDISNAARQAVAEAQVLGGDHHLSDVFCSAPKISIDYALMEKTDRAAVLPVAFAWSDLGAWDAIWQLRTKDKDGNAADGEACFVDSTNSFVRAPTGTQVNLVGVQNIAVVVDEGQVLVCEMGASQKVKKVVERLKAEGRDRLKPPAPFNDLEGAAQWFERWLRTSALPLWWSIGADHVRGGFHEVLTPDGEPLDHPRRMRVQARQTYVYGRANRMGWHGPWRAAAWHGLDYLRAKYRRSDGLYRTLVCPDGAPLDDTAMVYDQAFALLAMAELHHTNRDADDLHGEALDLLKALQTRRHHQGGFCESPPHPFQANAHMHLFEAAQAWMAAGGAQKWEELAAEIVDLALTRFIDTETGVIWEFFDANWSPEAAQDHHRFEPGHQFEWATLLEAWGQRQDHAPARKAAIQLFSAGLRGVDMTRGVAVDALSDVTTAREADARLWPQTEYLKAALTFKAHIGEEPALAAARALAAYLQTPAAGVWRDKLRPDGAFVDEPAPASSLYHITGAVAALSAYRAKDEVAAKPNSPRKQRR